jgi:hypothetical protein
MFPPVIPLANYPLSFRKYFQVANPPIVTTTGGSATPSYGSDSGAPYNGANASIYGHQASDAFDGSDSTYWLSVGNDRPNGPYSYEYVEGHASGTVSAVTYKVWGGPYRVFVSVKVGGVWQGRSLIPYDPDNPVSAPNGANIRYVASQTVSREGTATFGFKTPYANVQAVRLTFTNLYNSHLGPFPYRAGVRTFTISSSHTTSASGGTRTDGEYGDYSEIVKYLLASGGFHWPKTATAYQTWSDGSTHSNPASPPTTRT